MRSESNGNGNYNGKGNYNGNSKSEYSSISFALLRMTSIV
jgi:hypothetical protein